MINVVRINGIGEPREAEFIAFAIGTLERRINLMDNKASIILALDAALAILITATIPFGNFHDRAWFASTAIMIAYAYTAVVAWLSLLVIRPSFKLGKPPNSPMWLTPSTSPSLNFTEYLNLLNAPPGSGLRPKLSAMRTTHQKLLQMASKKMVYYHITITAVRFLIVYLMVIAIGSVLLQALD